MDNDDVSIRLINAALTAVKWLCIMVCVIAVSITLISVVKELGFPALLLIVGATVMILLFRAVSDM